MKFQPPKGTRDFLPEEAIQFQKLIELFRTVAKKYGFEPIITPAFENFELLSAKGGLGEAVKDEIYYFKDKSDRELGLRFDMTMPLARVMSSNPQLLKPFKRFVVDKVWRYDNPQAMRFREFYQADIDTVGVAGVDADAEILALTCDFLKELDLDFKIRISDRRIIEEFLKSIPSIKNWKDITISLDKMDKIGEQKVKDELKTKGLDEKEIEQIFDFLSYDTKGFAPGEKFSDIENNLQELRRKVNDYGFGKYINIDLFLVRGLEYYTSFVFEVNLGSKVSCGGGGRYDNLTKIVNGIEMPATGISLGLDRIFEVIKERKKTEMEKSETKVFVATVNENVKKSAIEIAQELRNNNISCQIDLMNRKLTKQLEYADRLGIPYVIVVGEKELIDTDEPLEEKELKQKKFKLKDMKKKSERELSLEGIIRELSAE